MVNRSSSSSHRLTGLLPLLLFAVFAACVCTVVLTGADGYRELVRRDSDAYTERTASQYIAVKIRQSEHPGAVTVGEFGGQSAILLRQNINGQEFVTRLYCYDGWLRELFSLADSGMSPEDGEKLLVLNDLSAVLNDGLLTVTLTDPSGDRQTLILNLMKREGETP